MTAARLTIVVAVLAVLGAVAFGARAGTTGAEERVERLAAELRCPVCQGLAVGDSPSPTAREMHALVAERVAQGRTDDEIRDEFRSAYGEWVFLAPPTSGPSALMWLLPLALIGLGGVIAWRRARGRADVPAEPLPGEVAALRARVAAEEAADL